MSTNIYRHLVVNVHNYSYITGQNDKYFETITTGQNSFHPKLAGNKPTNGHYKTHEVLNPQAPRPSYYTSYTRNEIDSQEKLLLI